MSRQGKTKRRLTILLGTTLALGLLAGGGALYRWHYINQRAQQGRIDGLASMERGDYPAALTQLGKYLSRNPNDVAVLLPYAKARRLVEEPGSRQLGQAIALYQRVLALSPGQPEAQSSLLELYYRVNYNTEALALANDILAKTPADTTAMYTKIDILWRRLQKADEAQANTQLLTRIAPLNLKFHLLAIQIMVSRGKQKEIEPYVRQLAQSYPGDDRFVLLQSIAATFLNDSKTATDIVRPLVTRPQPDATYTDLLVRQLDGLELYGDAYTVLQSAARDSADPATLLRWAHRLFETNRLPLLIDQTAKLDPALQQSDVELLALRALALVRIQRRPEALPILAALETRARTEPAAAPWAACLRGVVQSDSADPVVAIQALRNALASNPDNAVLVEQLGDAYAAAGARDMAVTAWGGVAHLAPAWSEPLVRLSQAAAAEGRSADALAYARAAQRRAPEDHDVLFALAAATGATLPQGPSADATALLTQLDDLAHKFPDDFGIPAMRAHVLAQSGQRDQAVAALQSILTAVPPAPERIFLTLAAVSENFKLQLEEDCFDASQKAHGLTPELALVRARWLARKERTPEALAFLEKARAQHADDPLWRSAWAAFLDLVSDSRAKAEWITLADANPGNVALQWNALQASAVQTDHAFVGRVIDRLTALIGDDSVQLRLMRATWLLQGQPSDADATQASIILSELTRSRPEMVAPRLLLAKCLMRLNDPSGAIDQLAAVCDLQPEQPTTPLQLAGLLQSRGDFSRARTYIDRAVRCRQVTLMDLRQAASLLALQGEYTTALDILEKAYAAAGSQPPDLVLAALYRQLNQPTKAEEICHKLLEKPDASSISFAADLFASLGHLEEARKTLSLLDGLKLNPGAKEYLEGQFFAKYAPPEEALKFFRAATQAAPGEIALWRQLVTFCLADGKIDDALAAADQASEKITGTTGFEALRENAALIRQASNVAGTRPLLMTLSENPADNAPALEALRILTSAHQQKETLRATAAKLRKLADANPRLLPLQSITLQFYMDSGQADEAVSMAIRTVQSFPASVEPLRLATSALGASQRWDQALGTAKEWRRLGAGQSMDADLAIAAAELHLGNADAASQQLQPYLEQAHQDPDKFSGVILLQAQGLLAAHQPEQAEALLGPLLAKSPQWRSLWLTLAVRAVDTPTRAQAWLDQVTPLVAEDLGERTLLAQSWMSLGRRWNKPEFDATGRRSLEAIIQLPDAPLSALLLKGNLCETDSDLAGAEKSYRRALERQPTSAIALNNLAYVLVNAHGNLDEARQLIGKALALFPDEPAFLDTKASVLDALKDFPGAIASLKQAQRLDPQNLHWRLNLLAILIDSGQVPAARAEMQQIKASLDATPNLAPEIRQRYATLLARLPQ